MLILSKHNGPQMKKIKFGTDGWRAIIAESYTVNNVKRVAEATAKFMVANGMKQVVIGYDCRFGGKMFAETTASVIGAYNIKVLLSDRIISTPMVSLGVVKTKSDMGVVITASHNPASYNGYKLKSSFGGPTIPADIAAIEQLIPETAMIAPPLVNDLLESDIVEYQDFEQIYIDHVEENFDLDAIKNSGIGMAYDAMYGAGQDGMKRLFPDAHLLHCDKNPSFMGQAPEPIEKNLTEISKYIADRDDVHIGIANDGDADRIGMFDEEGHFVDSHRILLLLLFYQFEHKKLNGKVVITFSVTEKMKKLAELYGLDIEVTKIGFKYIAEIMIKEDILVGGEESGGLAVKGHIPERDGIWIGIMILELMAKTGKSLKELIDEVYAKVGGFAFERDDLRLTEEKKQSIIENCANDAYSAFGPLTVVKIEKIDGFKFHFEDGTWVMIRPSGTEPVLRVYAEAPDRQATRRILDTVKNSILP